MRRRNGTALALYAGLCLVLAGAFFAGRPAHAARSGSVDVDGVELLEGPGKKYKVLEKLPKGMGVAASSFPTEGFFKVRTTSGSVGWVSADALVLQAPAGDESPAPPPAGPTPTPMAASNTPAAAFRDHKPKKRLKVKLLGGVDFFSVGDVDTLLGFEGLKTGVNFGGELGFILTPDLAMVVRLERITKSVVGRDTATLNTFQLDLNSTPAMIGVDLTMSKDQKVESHFEILGGLAVQTNLSATALNLAAPNQTDMSAVAFTGLVKFDATWEITKTFGFMLEAGYRVLKSVPITPLTTPNGSQIFQQNGVFTPVSLDLSGPVLGGGVTAFF